MLMIFTFLKVKLMMWSSLTLQLKTLNYCYKRKRHNYTCLDVITTPAFLFTFSYTCKTTNTLSLLLIRYIACLINGWNPSLFQGLALNYCPLFKLHAIHYKYSSMPRISYQTWHYLFFFYYFWSLKVKLLADVYQSFSNTLFFLYLVWLIRS